MKRLAVVTVLLAACCVLRADDAGLVGAGGAVQLMRPEHSSIRMVREDASVKILDEYKATVSCTFIFKNEGKATTVKMGFPEQSWGDIAPNPKSKRPALIGFKSWVDGKPVKTVFQPSVKNATAETYEGWHVKSVPFAAGQTQTVVDTYSGGVGGDSMGGAFFEYTLKSGASWKGKIGEAVITVDATSMLDKYVVTKAEPKGGIRRGGVFKWTIRNFEPSEDIWIDFEPLVKLSINGRSVASSVYDRKKGVSTALACYMMKFVEGAGCSVRGSICTIRRGDHVLRLTAGSRTAILDRRKRITLPRATFIVTGKNYEPHRDMAIPVASVVRALGGKAKLIPNGNTWILDVSL